MTHIVIACSKSWFSPETRLSCAAELNITYITDKSQLNMEHLNRIKPDFIFFPHWHWKVEKNIYQTFECVAFHTAPLPFGRGGSPIQNLILRGFEKSPVCALKMNDKIDAGPIYSTREISLAGKLDEIFERLQNAVKELIIEIVTCRPSPKSQAGEVVNFKRLQIEDNRLPQSASLKDLYDRVRMLDSNDYPKSFIEYGEYKLEFQDARLLNGQLEMRVILTPK